MNAELELLNETWSRAWFEKDADLVETLMAREYIYIAPNGQILDRKAILEIIRSASYQLYNGARTEVVIKTLASDVAALVYRWQGEGTFDGKFFKEDHRGTMVCARRGADWQVVLEHCSPNHQ